jgi:hypothetical protein
MILPRPPFHVRGRCGESDGGLFLNDGGGEGFSLVCAILQCGRGNEFYSSTLLAVGECRPAIKAMFRPYQMPVMDSGAYPTSKVRPYSRSASACIVFAATSGSVPVSVLDGSCFDLHLDGGEREGQRIAFSNLSMRSFLY